MFGGGDPGSLLSELSGAHPTVARQGTANTPSHCKTGADANRYVDCRVVLTAQSLDTVWGSQLPQQAGREYTPPRVTLFTGAVSTGCGRATSAVGPFYCPADRAAYFRFGSSGGPLAQEYVVAHEVGALRR